MNNELIIAAAGSGKTRHLINKAIELKEANILITTFTEENEKEIRNRFIVENKCIPSNVTIQTWFSFLIQHGLKPYQSYLYNGEINGLFLCNGQSSPYSSENDFVKHYLTHDHKIFSDKLAKFVCRCDAKSNGIVIERLSKIYSHIFIDEIQDLAGYDLDFLLKLFVSSLNILLVGEPRQGTYSTNNGLKNKKFSKNGITDFFDKNKKKYQIKIDEKSLNTNYRCTSEICNFSNKLYPNMFGAISGCNFVNDHIGVFFVRTQDLDKYLNKYNPTQLRDSIREKKINPKYPNINFGKSKGLSFDRVIIFPTQPILNWILKGTELPDTSKAKFYVAITRAKYSVAIVYDYTVVTNIEGIKNFSI